jgi:hypothetical protein
MASGGRFQTMKAVVLGAGASFGASANAGVRCPLVNGIVATAAKVGLFANDYASASDVATENELRATGASIQKVREVLQSKEGGHLVVLQNFIFEQLGIELGDYANASIDFEKLFALVEAELLGYHGLQKLSRQPRTGPGSADVLEMQLMLILCGSILCAIRGLSCEFHEALARWLNAGDMVMSFNYDLLIDRALRKRSDWFPNDGYGLTFFRLGRRSGQDVEWRQPLLTRSAVTLLKLHGSMNWLYPRDSWETVLHADLRGRPKRDVPQHLFCLDEMSPSFESDHPLYEWWERYDFSFDDYTYDLHSVIIPPTIAKPYRSFEPLIGDLWAKALKELLERTTELFLIGYSLRPDDTRSWWLFRKIASESHSLRRVIVVDPSDEVFNRVRDAFGRVRVERGPTTLADFAQSLQ